MLKSNLFFLALFLLNSIDVRSQEETLFTWFDDTLGLENSGIFNGVEFIDTYNLLEDQHRFFQVETYRSGWISYDNQKYFDIPIKYDLFEDQLIAKVISKEGGANQILLLNEKIDNFKIDETYFERIQSNKNSELTPSGFYELLTEINQLKLYKKHQKKVKKVLKNNSVYYKFMTVKPEYFVLTDDDFFVVKKKKDLISRFPDSKSILSDLRWNSKNTEQKDKQLISAIHQLSKIIGQ